MLIRIKVDRVKNPVDNVTTVPREQGGNIQTPFLQSFLRVEQIGGVLQLSLHGFISSHLRTIKARAQPINLIIDLASSFLEGVSKSRIDAFKLLLQSIQLFIERFGRVFKCCSRFFTEISSYRSSDYVIRAGEKILQANSIAFQSAPRVLFHER